MRGFCGIGIYQPSKEINVGGLLRSAQAFGASFAFVIGSRFKQQSSDTGKAWKHLPLLEFQAVDDLKRHLPYSCCLVAVEIVPGAKSLAHFAHPERACYLLGNEGQGIPPHVLGQCHTAVVIPSSVPCLNVATAGSIVLYDRTVKRTPVGVSHAG
jgi:tRNA G18 (ribose-2'-O)-methylase SpoU